MMRDSLDGVLLVDKGPGMTSHDVVAVARRCLNMKKIGHCGTLDPMATGMLILVLGIVTTLVVDLDRPQEGFLNVSQQALLDVGRQIGATIP